MFGWGTVYFGTPARQVLRFQCRFLGQECHREWPLGILKGIPLFPRECVVTSWQIGKKVGVLRHVVESFEKRQIRYEEFKDQFAPNIPSLETVPDRTRNDYEFPTTSRNFVYTREFWQK